MKVIKAAVGIVVSIGILMVPQMAEGKASTIYSSRLVNCEDMDIQPCYTYDEGRWRVVYSYSPYKAKNVKLCSASVKSGCLNKADRKNRRVYKWTSF